MNKQKYTGLTEKEIIESRELYGSNQDELKKKESIFTKILDVIKEPALSLLLLAASIYFFLGEIPDGIIMLCCVLFTCSIEFFEEYKTDKALEELNKLTDLQVKVIRNNKQILIKSEDLVVGDIVILSEGDKVPADGIILESYALGINESSLTGESTTVYKTLKDNTDNKIKKNICYKGTDVINGSAIIKIIAVGKNTEYGKIGHSINEIKKNKNNLQKEVNKIVKISGIISIIVTLLVVLVSYINNIELPLKDRIISSLISGITVGIATIPEEIPVVMTVFLALGAWRLSNNNSLTKNINSVETLGEVTVLCTDKTGTITENKMTVKDTYIKNDDIYNCMYYSNPINTFDNMELSLKDYANDKLENKNLKIIHEFIFNNEDKMMGQIIENNCLYVKGAYESIVKLCNLSSEEKDEIENKIESYSKAGLRVLALAESKNVKVLTKIKDYKLDFLGLVAFHDPIKSGIKESVKKCHEAGIRVILITGDSSLTASNIAYQIGIDNYEEVLTGKEIYNLEEKELVDKVKKVNVYARVYPEDKVTIVNALEKNNSVVAMTGDGINDAVALKKANIGISMGSGTNVCKESSDIVLLDDNFNTIVKTIEDGRNIYNNIKKSIMYILGVHIPIALLSLVIPLLGLPPFLLPIHIVISELLIDPTSAILFEKIKPNKNIMSVPPRKKEENIINKKALLECLSLGFFIFIITFISYVYFYKNYSFYLASTISYSILIISIILSTYSLKEDKLTIINIFNGLKEKIDIIINGIILIILNCIIYIPFLEERANTTSIGLKEWIIILLLSFISIIPNDIYKLIKKRGNHERNS